MKHLSPSTALVLSLTAAFCLVSSGCGKEAAETPQTKGAKEYTVGMSQCNLGEPWRAQMNADIKAAAEKQPGLRVIDSEPPRSPEGLDRRIHSAWKPPVHDRRQCTFCFEIVE